MNTFEKLAALIEMHPNHLLTERIVSMIEHDYSVLIERNIGLQQRLKAKYNELEKAANKET